MNKKIRWITETALMLALLVSLQALTKPAGQLVTGSCVNLILATATLLCGCSSGLVVALVSPVLALLLGIAPQTLTVPAIMVGNSAFVLVLHLLGKKNSWIGMIAAAILKFLVLYGAVKGLICGLLADRLLQAGLLKAPMLQALPASFGIMQLFTALIGGSLAILVAAAVKKAVRK